jgi:C-terminal processing protease CtpA/Prc
VKLSRPHGIPLGIELAYDEDNQNPGVRISTLLPGSPAGAVAGALSAGDVLVAVNGELVLEATLNAVAALIDGCVA